MQSECIRIGTRGSPLALWQANEVRDLLVAAHDLDGNQVEIKIFKTSGDKIQDKSLREFGGKGLFTKELEEALLNAEIDLAVHSIKDMQTHLPVGLEIGSILKREDVRDAFISLKANSIDDLQDGAVIGTSSLRRQAQIKQMRPDLEVITFRGNVETRLRKLEDGMADATLLACAGLKRLGYEDRITSALDTSKMLPAVAQGAIGIEVRSEDETAIRLIEPLNHKETACCVNAERAFLAKLDGSCKTPIAGLAEIDGENVKFRGMILKPDGTQSYATSRQGPISQAEELTIDAAAELLHKAGPDFFENLT